jgi:hypothetical protein
MQEIEQCACHVAAMNLRMALAFGLSIAVS